MILHPEYQEKAQKEIDALLDFERLPEFSDRKSLPYVECILQEIYRCVVLFRFRETGVQTQNSTDVGRSILYYKVGNLHYFWVSCHFRDTNFIITHAYTRPRA